MCLIFSNLEELKSNYYNYDLEWKILEQEGRGSIFITDGSLYIEILFSYRFKIVFFLSASLCVNFLLRILFSFWWVKGLRLTRDNNEAT